MVSFGPIKLITCPYLRGTRAEVFCSVSDGLPSFLATFSKTFKFVIVSFNFMFRTVSLNHSAPMLEMSLPLLDCPALNHKPVGQAAGERSLIPYFPPLFPLNFDAFPLFSSHFLMPKVVQKARSISLLPSLHLSAFMEIDVG